MKHCYVVHVLSFLQLTASPIYDTEIAVGICHALFTAQLLIDD